MKHPAEHEPADALDGEPERRRHPRVYENLPAEIGLAGGQTMRLTLLNISLSGAQFGCDESELQRIKTEGFPALHGQTVELGVRVGLPSTQHPTETLEATCRVVYTRRITQQRYCIGTQFTELKGQGHQLLMQYLLEVHRA
ncbi:MAG TPA: PilZ domain-containing protein [Gammaproteobacteria bacterium]|jgi:hypothetical protein|nr:PilZ domain-containing protein [Gammaproteobacteria bacterium]